MIELIRQGYMPFGTFGELVIGDLRLATVERPWLNNQQDVSCIPEGEYQLKLGMFNKKGYEAFELLNVPDRTHVKIHIANIPDELNGCIAPGIKHGTVYGRWGVVGSAKAYKLLMNKMKETGCDRILIRGFYM